MPWTTPKTWQAGELVTATQLNTYLRDNQQVLLHNMLAYLTHRPVSGYTTTSTGYVAIDTTHLQLSATTRGGSYLLLAGPLLLTGAGTGSAAVLTFLINGQPGLAGYWVTPALPQAQPYAFFMLGVYAPGSAGTHTFSLGWRSSSGPSISLAGGCQISMAVIEA